MPHYTNISDSLQTIFSYSCKENLGVHVNAMVNSEKKHVCDELRALRLELDLSMDAMSKLLGYSSASSYNYYEDKAQYQKDYFETTFLNRLKRLAKVGVSDERLNVFNRVVAHHGFDRALHTRCAQIVDAVIKNGYALDFLQGVNLIMRLYDFVIDGRKRGKEIEPTVDLAEALMQKAS